jgi:Flp pilus assembly pilin Flp
MGKFKNLMKAFAKDDSGAAMVEYAVILVVVALVGGVVLALIGGNIDAGFTLVNDILCTAITTAGGTCAT